MCIVKDNNVRRMETLKAMQTEQVQQYVTVGSSGKRVTKENQRYVGYKQRRKRWELIFLIGGIEDVIRHNQRIKSQTIKNTTQEIKPKIDKPRAKYGNQKVEVDGIKYDSKKEARRAEELEYEERLGEIENLERQKKYELQPGFTLNGHKIRPITYIADFVYEKNGEVVVEDVKSEITRKNQVYKLKKKMMMYVHNIEIKEI